MASKESSTHISQLTKDALQSFDKGDVERARQLLLEASSIDPENPELKRAWETVQRNISGSELPNLCRTWIETKKEDDIDAALNYLTNHPSASEEVLQETMEVLMTYT